MCDGYRCRLKVTRAAMLGKANVTITQQITLYLLDQYYLRYHEFTMKTKTEIYPTKKETHTVTFPRSVYPFRIK